FFVIGLAIALQPSLALWSGAVLQLAAFCSLGAAMAARRTAWPTIIVALALIALRHEYVLIGAPYVVAAIVLPREAPLRRGRIAAAIAGWLAMVIGLEIAIAVNPVLAVRNAIVLL